MPKTTRPHQHHRCCLAALLGLMAPAYASGTPTMAELFHAKYLKIPTQNEKLSPSVMRGNFTFFSPSLLDVKVEGSSLRFRMGAENGTIGWGNFGGRQRVSERDWPKFPIQGQVSVTMIGCGRVYFEYSDGWQLKVNSKPSQCPN